MGGLCWFVVGLVVLLCRPVTYARHSSASGDFSLLETGLVHTLCCKQVCWKEAFGLGFGWGVVGLGWCWLLCWLCCWVCLAPLALASSPLPGCPPSCGRVGTRCYAQCRPCASFISISMHVSGAGSTDPPVGALGLGFVGVGWLLFALGAGLGTATGYVNR